MLSEFKINTSILVDSRITEKFQKLQKYAARHEDEVEDAGSLSIIEQNFSETDLAMIGQLVLSEMLLSK